MAHRTTGAADWVGDISGMMYGGAVKVHSGLSILLGFYTRGKRPARFGSGRGCAQGVLLRWYIVEKLKEGRRVFCIHPEQRRLGDEKWWDHFPTDENELCRVVDKTMDRAEGLGWKMVGGVRTPLPLPVIRDFTVEEEGFATRTAVVIMLRSALVGQLEGARDNVRKKLNARIFFLLRKIWSFDNGFEEARGAGFYYELPDAMGARGSLDLHLAKTVDDSCTQRD